MRRYRTFGLDLIGDVTLAGMPSATGTGARQVRMTSMTPDDLDAAWSGPRRGAPAAALEVGRAGDVRFTYPAGRFLADREARTLACAITDPGIRWQADLLGEVLVTVALMRGMHVLEGSAVATDDGVVALLGPAPERALVVTELLLRGCALVTSDFLALVHRGGRIEVHPGPPAMRVRLPHGRSVAPTLAGRTLATFGPDAWVRAHRAADTSAPLAAICTLRPDEGADSEIAPLPPTPLALVPHDRGCPTRRGARPDLDFYGELAAVSPHWRISGPVDVVPALGDLVLSSLAPDAIRVAA